MHREMHRGQHCWSSSGSQLFLYELVNYQLVRYHETNTQDVGEESRRSAQQVVRAGATFIPPRPLCG
jgi:hypothetical protein